jgi:hypothetical protein
MKRTSCGAVFCEQCSPSGVVVSRQRGLMEYYVGTSPQEARKSLRDNSSGEQAVRDRQGDVKRVWPGSDCGHSGDEM